MTQKCGILLVNLGSPDAPTAIAVRPYLGQFLHDYRVVDMTRWLWCPILHGIILRVRPARSAKAYAKIWHLPEWNTPSEAEGQEAPLIRITRAQAAAVQARLGEGIPVDIAMRYGNPSIPAGIDSLVAQGCTQIGVLPLYPQFAGATTASVFDGVANAVKDRKDMPSIRFIRAYHNHPLYIQGLAESVQSHLETLGWKPDTILTSYHGIPQRYVDQGDPYQTECAQTTDLLRDALELDDNTMRLTFQSRFGFEAWLQPYTDKTLEALPEKGVKKVAIMTPGFSADCLETLEEINIEARETFLEHGGENFSYIPCLNTDVLHIDLLETLIREQLLPGWV